MNILALDIATKTGWCSPSSSGVWDFSVKRDESGGMKLIRLKAKLLEVLSAEQIKLVVLEKPAGFHKNALIHEARLIGAVQLVLTELGVDYREYSPTEIKKIATGKSNPKKNTRG